MSIRASNVFEPGVQGSGFRQEGMAYASLEGRPCIPIPERRAEPTVVMATIPAMAEDPDPGHGNSAGTERPMAVSRDEPRQYVNRGRIVTLYAGHPSLPPDYDPMRETHDGRMPLDEDDE